MNIARIKQQIIILLFCLVTIDSIAQVDPLLDNLRNVVPPSPNASSLGKFGEWPVSLYTGVPSISVPLYTLKGRSVSIPISVDYHAAGIRVGEVASWVGLGWALNAGGCISRTVQGLADEDGYFTMASNCTNKNNFCGTYINANTFQNYVLGAVQGNLDTQEDIYNLSVLGKSFRIYIDATDSSAHTMPTSNIKITNNFLKTSGNSWTVILEDGTKMLFGGSTGNYVEQTSNSTNTSGLYPSSWYLQSIISPSGETILFTYTATTIQQPTHYSQSDNIQYLTGGTFQNSVVPAPFIHASTSTLTSTSTVTQLSLSSIESDITKVLFMPSSTTRKDLNGGVSLSEIKVLSKLTNQYVEDWTFNYSYSHAAPGVEKPPLTISDTMYLHNRLKLQSINNNPTDATAPQIWSFGYNPLNLPSQTSFAQDYWGFYNGATSNTSLLPTIPLNASNCTLWPTSYTGAFYFNQLLPNYIATGFMPTNHEIGNNRSANETYMQAEVLNRVNYPTGGYSTFNFEGNNQLTNQLILNKTTSPALSLNLNANSNPFTPTQSLQFTLAAPAYVNINTNSTVVGTYDQVVRHVTLNITDVNGTTVFTNSSGNFNQWVNLFLPGTYTLTLTCNYTADLFAGNNNAVIASAYVTYPQSQGIQLSKQLLGGLRVNNIQEFDGVSTAPINSKYYTYSSPMIINSVDTINDFLSTQKINNYDQANLIFTYYTKITRNTSSKYSLGSIQGGTVGYGQVKTSYGLNGVGGYTISTFNNDPLSQASPVSRNFPYPPVDPYSWRSGILLREQSYTAAGLPVKATTNNYSFSTAFSITNFKSAYATIYNGYNNSGTTYSGITNLCYGLTNENVYRNSTTDISYNTLTGDSLLKTTWFYYDNPLNFQPIRTIFQNSKGDTVLTYKRTALEKSSINTSIPLTPSASTAIDSMVARNMVGIPLESEQYTQGVLNHKALSNYKLQTSGLLLQDNVALQKGNNALETRLQFNKYDSKGNLIEQQKVNDAKHSYIYDYGTTYPIAEVIGADSTSIAFTSFEADGSGNWTIPSLLRDATASVSGTLSYNLANGSITKSGLTIGSIYIISYWSNNGSKSISGGSSSSRTGRTVGLSVGNSIGNWTYYIHTVTATSSSISISGTGLIDELRLYPQGAMMTSYTYTPLVGESSIGDANGEINYYEYDGFNRLKNIKDYQGNIIKNYQYNYANSCGNNCSVLPMVTFNGSNTLSYPVGVFNLNGLLLGNATNQSQYISLWNANAINSQTGTLSAGYDSLHFNLTMLVGKTPGIGIIGCRYYMFDLAYTKIDGIQSSMGDYVDFGDGSRMRLGKTISDTVGLVLASNSIFYYYGNSPNPYIIHTYPDSSLKTITIYHSDDSKSTNIDNGTFPATSLTKLQNLRGYLPQNTWTLGGSSLQQGSFLTVANIINWNSITNVTQFALNIGDFSNGNNPCKNLSYAQDFMKGNKQLNSIATAGYGFYGACYRDSTFKISRLKSDWNTYFTSLKSIVIQEEHWNHEDLSSLKNLSKFVIWASNQKNSNDPTNNPSIPIPPAEIDNIINQIAAGAGQSVYNGKIVIKSSGTLRTSASNAAVALLNSKGWAVFIDLTSQ